MTSSSSKGVLGAFPASANFCNSLSLDEDLDLDLDLEDDGLGLDPPAAEDAVDREAEDDFLSFD